MTDDLNRVLWEAYDADPDFWVGMEARMRASEQRWWSNPDLSVLRRVCAGSSLATRAELWQRPIENVCATL